MRFAVRRIAISILISLLGLAPVVLAGTAPGGAESAAEGKERGRAGALALRGFFGGDAAADSSKKSDTLDPCGQPVPPNLFQKVSTTGERPAGSPNASPATVLRKADLPKVPGGPKGTIYFFLGSLCPCTDAHRNSIAELMSLLPKRRVKPVAIFPNRGESVELVEHFFRGLGFKMAYVIDSTNRLVDKFRAKKTPEVFLVDTKGKVVYSGSIDDSVENLGQVKHAYLKNAVMDLTDGRPVAVSRAEGSGCWIVRKK